MNDQATTSEAITTVEPPPPLALPALMPAKTRALLMRATMEAESEVRALLGEYVAKHLKRDSDFGIIPGTPKPTLLKPGAEKLVDLFRCEPRYEVTHRIEQWDDSKPLFHYEFRCKVVERDTGNVLAEGFGSANSREGRYRWRNGERTCPDCKKATIIKGKAEYGGGFLCFAKKGGCGAKFPDNAPEIVDQQIGKVENDDVFTLVNTVLKMAKKRALVDGAIALARCSDLFTQDVEDLGDHHHHQADDRNDAPRANSEQRTQNGNGNGNGRARPEASVDAGNYEIQFGKNEGKRLRELGDNQLQWYAEQYTGRDAALKKHARTVLDARKAAAAEMSQKQVADMGDNPDWGMGDPEPAAVFASGLRWEGANNWTGKTLHGADLETLLRYAQCVRDAIEADDGNHIEDLKRFAQEADAAIGAKEPPDTGAT